MLLLTRMEPIHYKRQMNSMVQEQIISDNLHNPEIRKEWPLLLSILKCVSLTAVGAIMLC
jgi:hypothetical protein